MAYNASSRRSETPSLSKDIVQVVLDGLFGDEKFFADFLVAETLRESCTISFSRSLSNGFSRRGRIHWTLKNAFMTSAVMRLSSQISPACTR